MNQTAKILRHTAFPLLLRRDNRHSAIRHWRDLEQSQYWPLQKLLDFQRERLDSLLRHAYETVPYYHRVFDERGLTPDSFKDPSDLSKLPVLTRDMIRKNTDDLFSSRFPKARLIPFDTGGTTRRRMTFYRDQESHNIKAGAGWRFEGYMGRKPCDKTCYISTVHIDLNPDDRLRTKIKNRYLLRELMFHMGAVTEDTLERYYRIMRSFKPEYLKGFPNALDRFADYILAKGYHPPQVLALQMTGETLHPYHREKFTRLFGGPAFNMYGSREVGNTACECDRREGMHVAMETSIVEIIADSHPAPPGTEGEIIITDLTNYGFPMIRYAIEDHGGWVGSACSCGRNLALMSHGVGRLCDQYIAPDGTRHSALAISSTIAETGPPMGQIQYIQKSLTRFHILITNDPPLTIQIEQHIRRVIHDLVSPRIEVTFEAVDQLPREASGKIRYCICEIDRPGKPQPAGE